MIVNLSAQILVQPWRWWVVVEGYGPVYSNDFTMQNGALVFSKDIPNLHNPTNIALWVLGQGGTVQGPHVKCAVAFGPNPAGALNPILDVTIPAGVTSAHQSSNYPTPVPANPLAMAAVIPPVGSANAKRNKRSSKRSRKSN